MNNPRTPFSTRLSGSAKETELRIRNIVQWKKKRPPVALFVLTRESRYANVYQLLGMIAINYMIGGVNVPVGFLVVPIQILALGALIPIGLYSGKKATKNPWVQWAFYLFYPVHLALLLIGGRI